MLDPENVKKHTMHCHLTAENKWASSDKLVESSLPTVLRKYFVVSSIVS